MTRFSVPCSPFLGTEPGNCHLGTGTAFVPTVYPAFIFLLSLCKPFGPTTEALCVSRSLSTSAGSLESCSSPGPRCAPASPWHTKFAKGQGLRHLPDARDSSGRAQATLQAWAPGDAPGERGGRGGGEWEEEAALLPRTAGLKSCCCRLPLACGAVPRVRRFWEVGSSHLPGRCSRPPLPRFSRHLTGRGGGQGRGACRHHPPRLTHG